MPAVILTSVWRDLGYYMVLYLAGLQTIPAELYEAAQIDGASGWQRFRHVTLPGLRPTTFFVLIMLTISSFKVFDLIQVMTEGGPGRSTLVLSQLIFREGITQGRFGYSSAIVDGAVRHRADRHRDPVPAAAEERAMSLTCRRRSTLRPYPNSPRSRSDDASAVATSCWSRSARPCWCRSPGWSSPR